MPQADDVPGRTGFPGSLSRGPLEALVMDRETWEREKQFPWQRYWAGPPWWLGPLLIAGTILALSAL